MKNKIKFNLAAIFLFATSLAMASEFDPDTDGPPPPDDLPIDNYLVVLIIAGLSLAFYVFKRINRVENSSL